jgi:hypothetical protein
MRFYLFLALDLVSFGKQTKFMNDIFAKRKQLRITATKMCWLLGRKSKLSTSSKLLIYKTIVQPIWIAEYNSGVKFPFPT